MERDKDTCEGEWETLRNKSRVEGYKRFFFFEQIKGQLSKCLKITIYIAHNRNMEFFILRVLHFIVLRVSDTWEFDTQIY